MNDIEQYVRKVNKLTLDYQGLVSEINTFEIKCIKKKPEYSITVNKVYNAVFLNLGDNNFVWIINDIDELAKYNIEYFEMSKEKSSNTFKCPHCKLERLNHKRLYKYFDGEKVCNLCSYTKSVKCASSKCDIKTMKIDTWKKIEGQSYCPECYKELSQNMLNCVICKGAFIKTKNSEYDKQGTLCGKCISNGFERKYDDLFQSKERFNRMSEFNNTFNEMLYRTFGVEFEMNSKKYLRISAKECIKELQSIKLDNGKSLYDYVKSQHDGSLNSNYGIEIITTILRGDKGRDILEQLVKVFNKYFYTDDKCGLHIHIGVEDLDEENLVDLYYVYQCLEDSLKYYVHPRRIGHNMCRPLDKRTIKEIQEWRTPDKKKLFDDDEIDYKKSYKVVSNEHHYGLNFSSIQEHNTLEIRLMEGHLDFNRLLEWIKVHQRIIQWTKINRGEIYSKDITMELVLTDELYQSWIIKSKDTTKNYKVLGTYSPFSLRRSGRRPVLDEDDNFGVSNEDTEEE